MTDAKNDICTIIRDAEKEEVVITRHGKPAAVVIGFHDEDDWIDYRLEHDEAFLRKIAESRDDIRQGRFITLDQLEQKMANKRLHRTRTPRRASRR
jgi:prevent-host-death family protein